MARSIGTLGLLTSLLVTGCGAQHASEAPQTATGGYGSAKSQGYAQPAADAPGAAQAPAPAAGSGYASRGEAQAEPEAPAEESARPGLGTSWGESVSSRVHSTSFVRGDGDSPFATAAFFYNDERGVSAMTRGRYIDWSDSIQSLSSGITVTIADPGGSPLRAAHVDGRTYAVGHDGDRYVIRVDNRTPFRVEAVASVDGLDVIDGEDGDYHKRGYVIAPYDSLEVEGFRESQGSVRAFRFGATDDSYASRRGKGRNVGVIGVAVFREEGADFRWTPDEVRRRDAADPFPARFAAPPPPPRQWRAW